MSKLFMHLGAGAGDLDERANFRCGFTEFVKKNYKQNDKVILVEANPINIKKLRETYKNYRNIKILNLGIATKKTKKIKFYYTEDDAPHFQATSIIKEHVLKHYPGNKIKNFIIKAISINDLLVKLKVKKIDYLSIDLEGMDYEIFMQINLKKIIIENLSIEYLHLNYLKKKRLINYLSQYGFSYCGFGYDHNNFDYLFKRKVIPTNLFLSKIFLPSMRIKTHRFFNLFIFNKK